MTTQDITLSTIPAAFNTDSNSVATQIKPTSLATGTPTVGQVPVYQAGGTVAWSSGGGSGTTQMIVQASRPTGTPTLADINKIYIVESDSSLYTVDSQSTPTVWVKQATNFQTGSGAPSASVTSLFYYDVSTTPPSLYVKNPSTNLWYPVAGGGIASINLPYDVITWANNTGAEYVSRIDIAPISNVTVTTPVSLNGVWTISPSLGASFEGPIVLTDASGRTASGIYVNTNTQFIQVNYDRVAGGGFSISTAYTGFTARAGKIATSSLFVDNNSGQTPILTSQIGANSTLQFTTDSAQSGRQILGINTTNELNRIDAEVRKLTITPSVGATVLTDNYKLVGDASNFFTRRILAGSNTYWDTDASGNPRLNASVPVIGGLGWIISVGFDINASEASNNGWSLNGNVGIPRFKSDGTIVLTPNTFFVGIPPGGWTLAASISNSNFVAQSYQTWNNSFADALAIVNASAEDENRFSLRTAPLLPGINPTQTDAQVKALWGTIADPIENPTPTDAIDGIEYDDDNGNFEYQRAQGGSSVIVPTWQQVMAQGNTTNRPLVLQDSQASPNIISFQAPTTITSSYNLKLPTSQSSSGQVLTNDGSGNLYWNNAGQAGVNSDSVSIATSGIITSANASIGNTTISTSGQLTANSFIQFSSVVGDFVYQVVSSTANSAVITPGLSTNVPSGTTVFTATLSPTLVTDLIPSAAVLFRQIGNRIQLVSTSSTPNLSQVLTAGNTAQSTLTINNSPTSPTSATTLSAVKIDTPRIQLNATTSGFASLTVPATTTSYVLTLPQAQGLVRQTFVNDGTGNLSWITLNLSQVLTYGNTAQTSLVINDNATTPTTSTTISSLKLDTPKIQLNASTGGFVTLGVPALVGTSYGLVFPANPGTNGQILATDASGNLSWVNTASTIPVINFTSSATIVGNQTFTNTNLSRYENTNQLTVSINGAVLNVSNYSLSGSVLTIIPALPPSSVIQIQPNNAGSNGSGGGGTPAGSNSQIQYNSAGVFGANAGLTWDNVNGVLQTNILRNVSGSTTSIRNTTGIVSIADDYANSIRLTGTTTGNLPTVSSFSSTNTNVDLALVAQGTGAIQIGTSTQPTPLRAATDATQSPLAFTVGASGQFLTSAGASKTPYWSTLPSIASKQSLWVLNISVDNTAGPGTIAIGATLFFNSWNNLGITLANVAVSGTTTAAFTLPAGTYRITLNWQTKPQSTSGSNGGNTYLGLTSTYGAINATRTGGMVLYMPFLPNVSGTSEAPSATHTAILSPTVSTQYYLWAYVGFAATISPGFNVAILFENLL
jgi:hypothetical protein